MEYYEKAVLVYMAGGVIARLFISAAQRRRVAGELVARMENIDSR